MKAVKKNTKVWSITRNLNMTITNKTLMNIQICFFITIIKNFISNYRNCIKKEIIPLRIYVPDKVLLLVRIVKNNLNKLCQANKRYKNLNLKIQRFFIPRLNQNQKTILSHVKIIWLIKIISQIKIIWLIKIIINKESENCLIRIFKILKE